MSQSVKKPLTVEDLNTRTNHVAFNAVALAFNEADSRFDVVIKVDCNCEKQCGQDFILAFGKAEAQMLKEGLTIALQKLEDIVRNN